MKTTMHFLYLTVQNQSQLSTIQLLAGSIAESFYSIHPYSKQGQFL